MQSQEATSNESSAKYLPDRGQIFIDNCNYAFVIVREIKPNKIFASFHTKSKQFQNFYKKEG